MASDKIVIEPLDVANYSTWSMRMKLLLVHQGLWSAIEHPVGTVVDTTLDSKAQALVGLHVAYHHLHTVVSANSARAAWESLRTTFNATSVSRVMQLKRDLLHFTKGPAEPLTKYVARARQLQSDLVTAGSACDDVDIVVAILQGLPSEFQLTVAFLEQQDVLPSIDATLAKLLQAENRVQQQEDSSARTYYARQQHSQRQPQQQPRGQGHFQHPLDQRYAGGRAMAMAHPFGRGRQVQPVPTTRRPLTCYNCGQPGHKATYCPKINAPVQYDRNRSLPPVVLLADTGTTADSKTDWVIDTGATHSICNNEAMFKGGVEKWPTDRHRKVHFGETGRYTLAVGSGNVVLWCNNREVEIRNVLYVPSMNINLLSVSSIDQSGCQVSIAGGKCQVMYEGALIMEAHRRDGLYMMRLDASVMVSRGELGKPKEAIDVAELWHRRFGHLSYSSLDKLHSSKLVAGLNLAPGAFKIARDTSCEPCLFSKQARQPFGVSTRPAQRPLELVHMDVCGPLHVPSVGGCRYFATLLDDYSKMSVVRPIAYKSQVPSVVRETLVMLENQCGHKVQRVRSDNGTEYLNNELGSFLRERGIVHETTAPYTPEQNGAAERLNRTLVERVRAMLSDARLEFDLWADAVITASYIRNRSPAAGRDKTPYELFLGKVPDVSHMRVFGARAFVHVPKELRRKLEPVAREGVFIGYAPNSKAYRILMHDNDRVEVSRNVVFDERSLKGTKSEPSMQVEGAEVWMDIEEPQHVRDEEMGVPDELPAGPPPPQPPADAHPPHDDDVPSSSSSSGPSDMEAEAGPSRGAEHAYVPSPGRYPTRERRPPEPYWDSKRARVNVTDCVGIVEPTTHIEALQGQDSELWKEAMDDEMKSLLENGTWVLEKCPPGVKPVAVKWVFKVKRDAHGGIERYKARLCAKGFTQKYGIDYNEVFAPVSKQVTVRTLLSVVCDQGMHLHQMDIKTAFLNGDLEEDIYMQQPPGYEEGGPGIVCHLRKSLYGLKQAPRAWHLKLKGELEKLGLKVSAADPGLFILPLGQDSVYVLVYVDDILLASRSLANIQALKSKIGRVFDVKDLGEAHHFLGMLIERDKAASTLKLSQERLANDIIAKFGMDNAKARSVPLSQGTRLTRSDDSPLLDKDKYPYSELIGSLLYLSVCTRPDITQAVGALARHMANPRMEHWQAAKGVVRYLSQTLTYGIKYQKGSGGLHVYCDADYGGDLDTRRSTTGFVLLLNGGAISWSSRLQPTVAMSTVEAEYMAAAATVKEALWMRVVLKELGLDNQVVVKCDNQGALSLLKHPISSQRSKHIDIMHHFVRERVARKEVSFVYCSTESNVADVMTKPLIPSKFEYCVANLGIVS